MSAGQHNPHWDQLAASGQVERMAGEIELWRSTFQTSLSQWLQQASANWAESARPLFEDLQQIRPRQMAENWSLWRDHLADVNEAGHLLREDYLQQLGPTPLACLNSILVQVERLATQPDQVGSVGSTILADLVTFEAWADDNKIHGEDFDRLRQWIENLALGLLSHHFPPAQETRQHLLDLWQATSQEHARQSEAAALEGPTQSARWNSWILLLELCEHETQDHGPVLDSLDALDADVEDVATRLGNSAEVAECVVDYREASRQLRDCLGKGKKLKGWSQILPPILIDLDGLVPRQAEPTSPLNRVRTLCQEYEAGKLSTEQFQRGLSELSESLLDTRRQSRIVSAQHPQEAAFVESLGKLQAGLDILTGVERSGQASRLEMGCTLIEDGLAQIQRLEAGDGG